ncbi:hypothetical protein ANCCAN_10813 [Ancylostoma caninum]|uniref:Uncharacterized protein n=1 Tax=Ancylostoma caninum TaxID=29170 RepID=A0A368GHS8_ANCCA|nr:hypothetical protein ANCCAN_10813 [Ancylostoma caninum]
MISTACSPIVFPSTPSSESKEYQQAHGSAVVGETIVVTMAPVLSSPTNEASTVCLPTDLNKTPPRSTLTPSTPHSSGFHSIAQPLSRLSADASRSITYTRTLHNDIVINVYLSLFLKGGCAGMEKQRLLSSRLSSKPFSSHSALSRLTSSEYSPSNDGSNVGLASDDDMFAASKEMKAVILNATSEADINVHMDRRLRFRPSVALIEKQGIVRERVNQFRRLGNFVPMETISGRSSGLSSRSSIDAGSLTGDDDFIKPSAPPVTHSLNMGGTRRNSATPITSSVSQLSSTHPPPI